MTSQVGAEARSPPSLLTRLVEWAWPAGWSLAIFAIIVDRASGSREAVAGLLTAVGAILTLRAVVMLFNYRGVLRQMADRDEGRLGNRVSAALGVTLRSTRAAAALEFIIAIAWLGYGIARLST